MKKRLFKVLFIIETAFIVLLMLYICFIFATNQQTELYSGVSPDGKYKLFINELGDPDWPFGDDHLEIRMYEPDNPGGGYRVSFRADVSNNGMQASCKVEWREDSVQIVLLGCEQPTAYYILPFQMSED